MSCSHRLKDEAAMKERNWSGRQTHRLQLDVSHVGRADAVHGRVPSDRDVVSLVRLYKKSICHYLKKKKKSLILSLLGFFYFSIQQGPGERDAQVTINLITAWWGNRMLNEKNCRVTCSVLLLFESATDSHLAPECLCICFVTKTLWMCKCIDGWPWRPCTCKLPLSSFYWVWHLTLNNLVFVVLLLLLLF